MRQFTIETDGNTVKIIKNELSLLEIQAAISILSNVIGKGEFPAFLLPNLAPITEATKIEEKQDA